MIERVAERQAERVHPPERFSSGTAGATSRTGPRWARSPARAWAGFGAGALVLIALIVCLNLFCTGMNRYLEANVGPLYRDWGEIVLIAVVVVYAILLAVPFVPAVELGWAVMMWFGVKGTILAYLATVLALALAFALGRSIPPRWVVRLLNLLNLHSAARLAWRVGAAPPEERAKLMTEAGDMRAVPAALRYRYVLLAVLFNLPGNWLIGGGGGIAMLAGLSGVYSVAGYLIVVALAVAPVPLVFLANHWWIAP
jgi:hypothetical protein